MGMRCVFIVGMNAYCQIQNKVVASTMIRAWYKKIFMQQKTPRSCNNISVAKVKVFLFFLCIKGGGRKFKMPHPPLEKNFILIKLSIVISRSLYFSNFIIQLKLRS